MRFASEGSTHAPLNHLYSHSLPVLTAICLLSALCAASLTGCGLGKIDTSSSETASVIPSFKGLMMGGQSPIINASVKVYTTGVALNCGTGATGACTVSDTGYGNGTFLQEATQQGSSVGQDTDVNGNFSFPGGYRCPAGEFAYIVGSGGNPSNAGNPVNSKILLVAALGRCEDLYNAVTGDGYSYTSAPTVGFTNAVGDTTGSGAAATATVASGSITSVNVTNGGTGYTAVPTVTFTGGGGSGAYAVASMNLNAVTPVSGGSNYTQPPSVTFSGGGGTGATATAFLGSGPNAGQVVSYTINSPGSGYTSAPTVVLTNASGDTTGSGATAGATLQVASVSIPTGSGYTGFTGANVVVNEITTVAAGYALGNFATVSGSTVGIGATATNNAAKVSTTSTGCVAGVGSCTTTAAAGLYHAFLNAANLANPFSLTTLTTAPSTPAGNSSAVLPTALINTIANVLANCVDSGSTSPECAGLPGASDTFTAVKTLAANPTFSGTSASVNAFFNLPNGSGPFAPVLSAAPNDFSLAIDYPQGLGGTANTFSISVTNAGAGYSSAPTVVLTGGGPGVSVPATATATMSGTGSAQTVASIAVTQGTGYTSAPTVSFTGGGTPTTNATAVAFFNSSACATSCQGIQYTQSGALDANDVYYFGNQDVSSGTKNNLGSLASNGAFLSMSTDGSGNGYKDGYGVAVDTQGGVYMDNGGGSTSKTTMRFTTSGGVVSATAKLIGPASSNSAYFSAVDQANNLWIASSATTGTNLWESTYANSSATTPAAATGILLSAGTFPSSKLEGLAVDPAQNIWITIGSTVTILENTGTVGMPMYSASTKYTTTLDATAPAGGIAFVGTPTAFTAYISFYSGSGLTTGVETIVPTLSGAAVTGFTSHSLSSPSAISGTFYNEADGLGNIWLADANSRSIVQFLPGTTPSAYRIIPCLTVNTTCSTVFGVSGKPTTVSLDSTGSIWVSDGANDNIVQIIGSAAPTWPLLSLGKTGKP